MTDRFETLTVHAGAEPDEHTGGVVPAIQMSTTFKQDGVGGLRGGYEYGRSGNPTRGALEGAIAALEGASHGLAYASGLAATQNVFYLLEPGDRLLMSDDVYGGTWRLADKLWRRYGIETDAVDLPAAVAVNAPSVSISPARSGRRYAPRASFVRICRAQASSATDAPAGASRRSPEGEGGPAG